MTKFSVWEQVNLAVLLAILVVPTLLLFEITCTRQLSPGLVLINVIVAALFARFFIYRRSRLTNISLAKTAATPLLYFFLLQLAITIAMFSAYLALPDVDPYHWIKSYNQNFNTSPLDKLPQRPTFHTLIYSLDQIPYLEAETIFKYVIPLLALFTLLPAWLVARKYSNKMQQTLFLLVPLLSPSLIIHAQMGTPQAVLLILTIFFVFLLIYSHLTRRKFWHYLAGAIMLLAMPVHGLALLIFAAWSAATAWHHPRRLYILLLLLLIATLVTPYLKAYLPQVLNDVRLNLTFPSAFTTIDGVPNGWPGPTGVLQYYAFYLGLVVPAILLASLFLFFKDATYRRQLAQLAASSSALALIIMFAGFFSIAEVLPRLFNIVVLPDRAWLFAALAATVLLIPLFNYKFKQQKFIYCLLILLFAINIGGALFINNLKQHLLPDYAVKSARWINEHLSADTAVLLNRKPEYIDLYASARFITLPQDFYCRQPEVPISEREPAYLLFLKPDPLHPYAHRPWHEPTDTYCTKPAPNNNPDRFRQIYNDADQAIIWKVL